MLNSILKGISVATLRKPLMSSIMKNYSKIELSNSEDFDKYVKESDQGPIIMDFYAKWCGSCKLLMPILEKKLSDIEKVKLIAINVDKHGELGSEREVNAIPHVFLYSKQKIVKSFVGKPSNDKIDEFIAKVKEIN